MDRMKVFTQQAWTTGTRHKSSTSTCKSSLTQVEQPARIKLIAHSTTKLYLIISKNNPKTLRLKKRRSELTVTLLHLSNHLTITLPTLATYDRTVRCSVGRKLVLRIEGVNEGAVRWYFTPVSDPSSEGEVKESDIVPNSRGMHLLISQYAIPSFMFYPMYLLFI